MQKITPCLWFDNNLQEAVDFYTSVFKNSEVLSKSYYGEGTPMPKGSLMVVTFRIEGHEFMGLNGGPQYKFTEAISLMVDCKTQEEVDYYWEKLSAGGGTEVQCGWLKDKFGLAWQIVPTRLMELIAGKDPVAVNRVLQAMYNMIKIDIKTLEEAYKG